MVEVSWLNISISKSKGFVFFVFARTALPKQEGPMPPSVVKHEVGRLWEPLGASGDGLLAGSGSLWEALGASGSVGRGVLCVCVSACVRE